MAAAKKKQPSDLETLTPPINLDGSRPVPSSHEQAAIDADNQQLIDDALAGRIKLPGVNVSRDANPANPYASEGRDPNWKPPVAKDAALALGDAIVDAVPALRTWGAPDEKPKQEEPKGDITFVDRADGGAGSARSAPQVVPAHEVSLVSPERHRAEQEAYSHIQSGYLGQRAALEGQKDAEDEVAQARIAQNNARAEGDRSVADVADQARWNTEARALEDKKEQNAFRAKMEAFSRDLADDKIEYRTSLPQQITWGIARALGAVQQGLLHLPTNQVADQIDAHIKQALDTKKANHAVKRERLGDMQKFYDLAASQSKDQGERSRLAYGYALEAAKAEAAALANAAGNPLALAEAKKIRAALDEKSAQIETVGEYGTELLAAQASIRNHKWVQAGVAGGGGKPVDSKNVFFDPDSKTPYAAKNEKSREKLAQSAEALAMMTKTANEYADALGKLGTSDRVQFKAGRKTPAMSRALTLYQKIRGAERENLKTGVYNPGEEPMLQETLGHPGNLLENSPEESLRVITDYAKAQHRARMKAEAPDLVDRVPQPYGTAPKNVPTGEIPAGKKDVARSAVGFEPVGAKAKGGDVAGEQPYLVGEEGPELVVPNKPGFVLTALQTAALRGASPTKQQMDTLPKGTPKSAIQRFAEKAGVAREDGGAVTPEQQAADEEEIRRFMGDGKGTVVFEKPKTLGEAEQERQKAEFERREGERLQLRSIEEAKKRQERLDAEDEEKAYQDAHGTFGVGPAHAWIHKQAGAYKRPTPERVQQSEENRQKLEEARAKWREVMSKIVPASLHDLRIEDIAGRRRVLPDPSHRREDGGEMLPLYEPEGKELHQSLAGHAFYASNDDESSSRPSLSGPTPRYSAHAPVRAKSPAPPLPRRKPTPEELMRMAKDLERDMRDEHEARMAKGPAVSARACGGAMRPKGLAASISRDLEKTKRPR